MVDLNLLKQLRAETSVSVSDCRKALEEANGDYKKALEIIRAGAAAKAEKKADRETSQGLIEAYIHQNGKIGSMVEILCETDFVARTDEFKQLAHEVAMQIAAMAPSDLETLLKQEYIKDSSKTIEALVKEAIQKTGENILIKQFTRYEL